MNGSPIHRMFRPARMPSVFESQTTQRSSGVRIFNLLTLFLGAMITMVDMYLSGHSVWDVDDICLPRIKRNGEIGIAETKIPIVRHIFNVYGY